MQSEEIAPVPEIIRPKTWVDDVYSKVRLQFVLVSILAGVLVYALGLLIAVITGFQRTYFTSVPVYYGLFGISWVMSCIRWGVLRFPGMLDDIRVCFKDDGRFVAATNEYMTDLSSRKGAWGLSGIVFALGAAGLILGLFVWASDIQRRVFPNPWYEGSLGSKTIILLVWDAACSLPLGTGLWLLYKNVVYLSKLWPLEVIPLPGIVIARFRQLTAFYLVTASTWFVGVALLGLLFFKHLDIFSSLILSLTSAVGLATAIGPQIVFHRLITRSSSDAAGEFARVFKADLGGKIEMTNLSQFISILQASQQGPMWVINLKDILLLTTGQLLPLIALALKSLLSPSVIDNLQI